MMQYKTKIKRSNLVNAAVVIFAVAVLAILPVSMVIQANENFGDVPILVRTANLASPTGSVNPHGVADYRVYQSGQRELEIEAEDVSASNGTVLSFFINGTQVGQESLLDQRAKLRLRTQDAQSVPTINGGELVEVRNGATLLVSGNFDGAGPTPTPTGSPSPTASPSPTGSPSPSPTGSPSPSPTGSPSPSPTGSPSPSPTGSPSPSPSPSPGEGDIFAGLSGPTINGILPRGYAEYELHSSRTELEVRIRQINLPTGTNFSVLVNNVQVGQMSLESDGESRLRLRSDRGDTVPTIGGGETIEIKNGGTVILSGVFAGPSPSPSPTGSPSPSPSPSPSQARYFEAHLGGGAGAARGEVKVFLNEAETEATFTAEFHDLSSGQTGARVDADLGDLTLVHDF